MVPEFSRLQLDQVRAAVRIVEPNPESLLSNYDWFAGLSRLGKPVDMILMKNGSHVLEKPWERMISQQGDVDWFCYWLKDEVDPDPNKKAQYERWAKLRKEKQ